MITCPTFYTFLELYISKHIKSIIKLQSVALALQCHSTVNVLIDCGLCTREWRVCEWLSSFSIAFGGELNVSLRFLTLHLSGGGERAAKTRNGNKREPSGPVVTSFSCVRHVDEEATADKDSTRNCVHKPLTKVGQHPNAACGSVGLLLLSIHPIKRKRVRWTSKRFWRACIFFIPRPVANSLRTVHDLLFWPFLSSVYWKAALVEFFLLPKCNKSLVKSTFYPMNCECFP